MLNENGNILYDLIRFRCEIDFYNVSGFNFAFTEEIKTLLISEISTISYLTNNNTQVNKYYMKYTTPKSRLPSPKDTSLCLHK